MAQIRNDITLVFSGLLSSNLCSLPSLSAVLLLALSQSWELGVIWHHLAHTSQKYQNAMSITLVTSPNIKINSDPVDAIAADRDSQDRIRPHLESSAPISPENEAHGVNNMEATETPNQEQHYLTGFSLCSVIGALIFIMFLALLDTSIISTAIPVITDEFRSVRHIGWYGSGYQLANACMQPLAGKLYTFYSSKVRTILPTIGPPQLSHRCNQLVFLTFLAIFEVGSVVCGTARSSAILIIGRVIAGLGAAGIIGGSNIIMAAIVPLPKFPAFAGVGLGSELEFFLPYNG